MDNTVNLESILSIVEVILFIGTLNAKLTDIEFSEKSILFGSFRIGKNLASLSFPPFIST